nr:MAG TPA: hypothetical protein [Caudoviricetes sp.]
MTKTTSEQQKLSLNISIQCLWSRRKKVMPCQTSI